ncbi:MAG: hypothetical protein HC824_11510 [Synechococcales cyanobacterium RM1_1_8]|nr:hypothetical protein [Synechococcales cyanobacterium RM1_1_8]
MQNHQPPKPSKPDLPRLERLPWGDRWHLVQSELKAFYQSLLNPLRALGDDLPSFGTGIWIGLGTALGEGLASARRWPASWSDLAGIELPWLQPGSLLLQSRSQSDWARLALLLLPCLALLMWNWKLLLALVSGLAAMALIYGLQGLQERDWQPLLTGLGQWLRGPQRLLLLCVPSGSLAMLGTYMSASIWETSHDGWLVASIVIQGLGLGLGLVLLSWQVVRREGDRHHHQLDQALQALAAPNPLTRLVAVRQLSRLLARPSLSPDQSRLISQSLQLLLSQEPEAVVREAALRGLEPRLMGGRFDLDAIAA